MNMSRKAICITYHERSLESFENKGHILKMIGVGRRRGGRPIGNQQYDAQLEFLRPTGILIGHFVPESFLIYHISI